MKYQKNIILGVTGGIAAYKSADLIRRLQQANYDVRVVMTASAKKFITPLTLQALSGHLVHDDLFDAQTELAMGHIELARWADALIIAPASANCIAKLTQGLANDLLSTLCLATTAPIALAPAMNQNMWSSGVVQDNINRLVERGVKIFGPSYGSQACGDVGFGRMLEPELIAAAAEQLFVNDLLSGKHVLITAGPTHERLDPVRFIGNYSSGKMGFALAQAAREAGANVTLIAGPVELATPKGVQRIDVSTALEMQVAVAKCDCDIFIGAAAVADYRPAEINDQKIKKTNSDIQLALIKNPDIITEVVRRASRPYTVGFSLETENLLANTRCKLLAKQVDVMIANSVSEKTGFQTDTNAVTLVWPESELLLPLATKQQLAKEIVSIIAEKIDEKIKESDVIQNS